MKNAQLLFAFCICLFCSVIKAQQSESPRKKINFNREWKYAHGDVRGAERIGYNDSGWETVGVPHSFSIPYFMSKDFYVGYGWYRKSFRLSEDDLKKCTFIEFDGVFQEAEIYINGQKVGSHVGGYTGFSVDVTKAVKAGNNEMAVRVNNIWKPDVAPRAGEHVFSGGIYRNVRLVQKSKTYIDWYGTFVITPELKENRGKASTVKVATEVCNRSSLSSEYKLVTEVRKLNGEAVTSVTTTEYVGANDCKQFVQVTPAVNEPELWHPAHPSLYKLVSLLYKGNELLDSEETVFGFRWFEWTADRGFFLNGEHLFFKGANVHQDQAGWGDAVTEAAMRRDVKQMKEAGFDFIRGSHYPHAPAFSKACDEMGMLFWAEAPFWGIGGFGPDGYWNSSAYPVYDKHRPGFDASALQQLGEMIRIHRNHPSIVAWSMCNEAFFSAPEAMDGVRELLKKMVALSHQLDPTRPAAIGGAQRPLGVERIDKLGDIGGYNGDGATQPDFLNPGIPGVVSEYGSTTADRPGEYMPVYENERGTYIFNSKDLCMIEHIPELIDSGIDSFKIEGRMKTALYVATVARTYRKAIDDYLESPELYRKNMDWYLDQISNCTYRQFTTGFFFGKPDESAQIYDNNTYVKEYTYLGIIGECTADGLYRIEQRNKFSVGEQIEIMKPDGRNIPVVVRRIVDEEGQEMQSAPHPKQVLYIELAAAENGALSGAEVSEQDNHAAELYDILRRKEEE